MDTFWWIVVIVAIAAAVVFAVLAHSGLLYSPIIRISHPASMPRRSAYVLRTGPYKKAGKEFDRLTKLVSKDTNLFGVYYDDPDKVYVNTSTVEALRLLCESVLVIRYLTPECVL